MPPRRLKKRKCKARTPASTKDKAESYQYKPSANGNLLFAKLPPEIRCKIWRLLLIKPSGSVMPVHIPKENATETFFSVENAPNVALALDTLIHTCRLFCQDQESSLDFYKFNVFQFPRTRDCLTYVAAITPSRRQAIRSITITGNPIPFDAAAIVNKAPSDRLHAIAMLCPNLRVLRHEKFFYRQESLTDLAYMLCSFLKPIIDVDILPSLKEVYISCANGGETQVECHMTSQGVNFVSKRPTLHDFHVWSTPLGGFDKHAKNMVSAMWEDCRKGTEGCPPPLSPSQLKNNISSTPILTLGESRSYQRSAVVVRQNAGLAAGVAVPDWIYNGLGTVKDLWFRPNGSSPELLIGSVYYSWDSIFHSDRLHEDHSRAYLEGVVRCFLARYISWVYSFRTSKGRRHGNRSPQSKLINSIWRLKWQDRAAKLDMLKELYDCWDKRPRRRR